MRHSILLLALLSLAPPAALALGGEGESGAVPLNLRIVPQPDTEDGHLFSFVGSPLEVRIEFENTGKETIWLPPLTRALRVRLEYGRPWLGNFGWGPGPYLAELVELAPGGKHEETLRVVPRMAGEARVVVSLSSSHEFVLDGGREVRKLSERGGAVLPKPAKLPGLWRGTLSADVPAWIAATTHFSRPEAAFVRRLSDLSRGELGLLDRLEFLGGLAETERTETVVDLLLRRLDAPDRLSLEELECTKQLVLAVRRGYGFRALPRLLDLAGDEGRSEDVRRLAREAAKLARTDAIRVWEGRNHFFFEVPEELRRRAGEILGGEEGPGPDDGER